MAEFDNPIRVALADDHTMFRKGVVSILSGAKDMEVVAEAADGAELLAMLHALPRPPHVCLLDVNMAGMDGYDTLVAIKAGFPSVRVLMLTMMNNESVIIRMLRAQANGYLLKEYEPEEMLAAIRTVMRQRFYYTEVVGLHLVNHIQNDGDRQTTEINEKEQEFLRLCATDFTYKEIAVQMGVSSRTVEGYRDGLFLRLGINTRMGLAIHAIKMGLVSL